MKDQRDWTSKKKYACGNVYVEPQHASSCKSNVTNATLHMKHYTWKHYMTICPLPSKGAEASVRNHCSHGHQMVIAKHSKDESGSDQTLSCRPWGIRKPCLMHAAADAKGLHHYGRYYIIPWMAREQRSQLTAHCICLHIAVDKLLDCYSIRSFWQCRNCKEQSIRRAQFQSMRIVHQCDRKHWECHSS